MVICYVKTCHHNSGFTSCKFYRFPRDAMLRKLWEESIERISTKNSVVCSCHFKDQNKAYIPLKTYYDDIKETMKHSKPTTPSSPSCSTKVIEVSFQPITISDTESEDAEQPAMKKTKCFTIAKDSTNVNKDQMEENISKKNLEIAAFIANLIKKNEEIIRSLATNPKKCAINTQNTDEQNDESRKKYYIQDIIDNSIETYKYRKKFDLDENLSKNADDTIPKIEDSEIIPSSDSIESFNDNHKIASKEIDIQCEIGVESYRDMRFLPGALSEKSTIYKEVGIQCEMGYEVLRAI